MKKTVIAMLVAMLVCLLAPGTVLSYRAPDIAPARDFDIRGPLPNALPQPTGLMLRAPAQANALSSLQSSVQNLSIRWSALTGAPSRIDASNQALTGPVSAPARDIAINFLSRNLPLFNLSSQDVSETRISRNFISSYNGLTHLTIQQQINGIDVFGGVISINIGWNGQVLNVFGEPMPDAHASVNAQSPSITSDQAVTAAAGSAGMIVGKVEPVPSLIYFPMALGKIVLAWDVTIRDAETPNIYRTLVDAVDGTILFRQNLTYYSHVLAHGDVYIFDSPIPDNPEGTSIGSVDRVDAPFSSYAAPVPAPNTFPLPFIYNFGLFPHDDAHADWWNGSGQAGRTTTISNNVNAYEDRNGSDSVGHQPTAGAGENFTFPIDLTLAPSTYQDAAITNLFFWNNRIHDLYYHLGFDEVAGNFQRDNFGLGGTGNDPVLAEAQDNAAGSPPSLCNANFGTPGDGSSPRMQMFECNSGPPNRDGDLDANVIGHEYTHGVHSRLVSGLIGYSQGGMSEGWADFMALSMLSKPDDDLNGSYAMGQYLFNNSNGIRHQPYSVDQTVFTRTYANINDNAFCAKNVCQGAPGTLCTKNSDCGSNGPCVGRSCKFQNECELPTTTVSQGPCIAEVHDAGEFWAEALWLVRGNLVGKYGFATGNETMMRLVVDGMKLSPSNPDFLDERDAILKADVANNAGVNQCLIWDGFAKFGMGFSAQSTGSADINPVQAFDTPSTCTPHIQVSGNLNLGNVCLNNSVVSQLEVSNTGTGDLIVSGISRLSGSTDIAVDPMPQTPVFISADAHVDFGIRCTPSSAGSKTATIRIKTNDPTQPNLDLTATCNAGTGSLRVDGSPDFGDVCPGVQDEKTISVCNVGKCNLNVLSAAFSPACSDFVIINNPFPAPVSPDSCLGLIIRFTPTSDGPKSCTLVITSDDPTTPSKTLVVTANTPAASIDVPANLGFLPTVIQSVGACSAQNPFPISNTGSCNLKITGITIGGANASDFSLSGLPSFPIILEPGHVAGMGELGVVFKPTAIDRDRLGTLTVTYESDPNTHATTNETRALCGEGVRTGARVLVTAGGVPLPVVEKIQLHRINANRNKNILDTNDVAKDVSLQTVTPAAPCSPFQFHREYGAVSNPIQLLPGSYQVTVMAIVNGKRMSKSVGFDVDTCSFNQNITINF